MIEMEQQLLKKKLKLLKSYKGQGTQLISLFISPDADRSSVMKQLIEEQNQSSNIKSSQTRNNVQAALKRIINYLKQIDFNLPENGLALFSGDVSTNPSKSEVILIIIYPPRKLTLKLYKCDSLFYTLPLEEMMLTEEVYGVIVIDKREATIAVINGKIITIISNDTSNVPGKSAAGGQSAQRFERLRDKAEEDFYKRVGEKANAVYVGLDKFKGLIIGGPGQSKDKFLKVGKLDYRIKNKMLGIINVFNTDISGIKETLYKSENILKEIGLIKEKNLIDKFIKEISIDRLAIYGYKEVESALNLGRVDTILISEEIDLALFGIQDAFEYFGELSKRTNAKVELISMDTTEGKMFYRTFGGIAALLRYK